MNCCDANGNCNQGRDCPVRAARAVKPATPPAKQQNIHWHWVAALIFIFSAGGLAAVRM